MGYAVYEDLIHERWAGYGVPAECDYPSCDTKIDRGLGYQCEAFAGSCRMFFCGEHRGHLEHQGVKPKPDSLDWEEHLLRDESWSKWRDEHPAKVAEMKTRQADR